MNIKLAPLQPDAFNSIASSVPLKRTAILSSRTVGHYFTGHSMCQIWVLTATEAPNEQSQ